MRILFLTPQLPYPPHQGTSLRNYHILRGVAGSAEVSLLSFEDGPLAVPEPALADLCRQIETVQVPQRSKAQRLLQLVTTREADLALRLASDAFEARLRNMLAAEAFDIIQVEGLELARYMQTVRESQPMARIVLDCHNAEAELQRRTFENDVGDIGRWPAAVYSHLQSGRLAAYERAACRAADRVVAVSESDRAHLTALAGPEVVITVIPNSIDTQDYVFELGPDQAEFRHDLVYTGKMDYRPNVDAVLWFGEAVWPELQARHPDLTWAIVGQRPDGRVESLEQMPGIRLTGRVERVQPYLAGATVYVSPLRIGSGTRLKLLEAMAAGLPIVSTTIGAEGLGVEDGRDLRIADTAEALAEVIEALLESPAERNRLGQNARSFAGAFDWRRVVPHFIVLYEQLLA